MRTALLRLALCGLALAVAGCGRGAEDVPLVAVIGERAPALGAAEAPVGDAGSALLRGATAQGLVRLDPSGQIEPGLAERWNVSDDGLSYVFRLQSGEWRDGRPIRARDVARLLNRLRKGRDAVREAAGAIDDVVAMTDRVIEIRLKAPRPNLLTLLAQPEFALIRDGAGTGPFVVVGDDEAGLRLAYRAPGIDGEPSLREEVRLAVMPAAKGIAAFRAGRAQLLLGGTVADLPLVKRGDLPRGALQFDPASGLFGLVPVGRGPLAGSAEVRALLSQAIDRPALIEALGVPGLGPRATLLEAGLAGIAPPAQPAWLAQPLAERQAALKARLAPLLPETRDGRPPSLRVLLPAGPGGDMLAARLAIDWGALGLTVERATSVEEAAFQLIDEVAPSDSPAWFVRRMRCGVAAQCDAEADRLADEARSTLVPEARAGLLVLAARRIDEAALFIPLAAPIRWSLVSRSVQGFVPNRFARHSLLGLGRKPGARS